MKTKDCDGNTVSSVWKVKRGWMDSPGANQSLGKTLSPEKRSI